MYPRLVSPDEAKVQAMLLFRKIDKGDLAGIKECIDNGADLAFKDPETHYTPIMYACKKDQWKSVRQIAECKSADPEDTYGYGAVAVQAFLNKKEVTAETLLGAGIDLAKWDPEHLVPSPFHIALEWDDEKVWQALLNKNADLTATVNGLTPVEFAAARGQWQFVLAAATKFPGNEQDTFHYGTVLARAIAEEQPDTVINILMEAHAALEMLHEGKKPLHWAIEKNKTALVGELVVRGADLTSGKNLWSPMEAAVNIGGWPSVEAMAKVRDCDPLDTYHYHETLLQAARVGAESAVISLLNAHTPAGGALIADHHNTPAHYAVIHDKKAMLLSLIEHGAPMNVKNAQGETPLTLAAKSGKWNQVTVIANKVKLDSDNEFQFGQALLAAVKASAEEAVISLLQAGAPLNGRDASGNSVLHLAVEAGKTSILEKLLDKGADLAATNSLGQTPMSIATAKKKWLCMETIVSKKPMDAEDKYQYGNALLHAIADGKMTLARNLVAVGAKATGNVTDNDGNVYSIFNWVIKKGYKDLIAPLVNNGSDLTSAQNGELSRTPIQAAADAGLWESVVDIAGNRDIDANDTYGYGTVILAAVEANQEKAVEALLKAGVRLKTPEAIRAAVRLGNETILKHFIKFDPEALSLREHLYDQTPVEYAAEQYSNGSLAIIIDNYTSDLTDKAGYCSVLESALNSRIYLTESKVRLLIQKGACNNHRIPYAFKAAVTNGKFRLADAILENDPSVLTRKFIFGNNCLHELAANNPEGVSYLLEKGVNQFEPNQQQKTPLEIAADNDRWDIVMLLLSKRDKNRKYNDLHEENVLYKAIREGQGEVVRVLLEQGAIHDRFDEATGYIALNLAIEHNQAKSGIIQMLLDRGLDLSRRNKQGENSHDIARRLKKFDCLTALNGRIGEKSEKTAQQYRDEISKKFNDLCEGSIEANYDVFHSIFAASAELLQRDLASLKVKRDDAAKYGEPTKLLRERLTILISEINHMQKDENYLPEFRRDDKNEPELNDMIDYVERRKMIQLYIVEIRKHLENIYRDLHSREFQKKFLFWWIKRDPAHVIGLKNILSSLTSANTDIKLMAILTKVNAVFKNIRLAEQQNNFGIDAIEKSGFAKWISQFNERSPDTDYYYTAKSKEISVIANFSSTIRVAREMKELAAGLTQKTSIPGVAYPPTPVEITLSSLRQSMLVQPQILTAAVPVQQEVIQNVDQERIAAEQQKQAQLTWEQEEAERVRAEQEAAEKLKAEEQERVARLLAVEEKAALLSRKAEIQAEGEEREKLKAAKNAIKYSATVDNPVEAVAMMQEEAAKLLVAQEERATRLVREVELQAKKQEQAVLKAAQSVAKNSAMFNSSVEAAPTQPKSKQKEKKKEKVAISLM